MFFISVREKFFRPPLLRAFGIPLFLFSFLPRVPAFYSTGAYPKESDPQLALIGQSRTAAGQPIDLQLVSLGKDGYPCEMTSPPSIICYGPEIPGFKKDAKEISISCRAIDKGIYKPKNSPVINEEGYYLLTAKDLNGAFLPFGLPIHVTKTPPAMQLHWGDLHGHSTLSDGTRPPEEYYRWARDIARLDVIALTDHNWALDEEKIEKKKELANVWYEPGRFVPFLAFEWAEGKARPHPSRGRPNHKHLIFRNTNEIFSPWAPWKDTPSVMKLWEMLEGRDVIAIPHHTGLPHKTHYGTDWSRHNGKFERVAEIFSDWGSSECAEDRFPLPETEAGNFIRDALSRGFLLGVVGGSDTHTSRPGLNVVPHQGHPYALTALTAIESPSRTRDEIWKALYNRRCYATSGGRRILLEFHLNGEPMGTRITRAGEKSARKLEILIAGSTNVKEILIVKNGEKAHLIRGEGWCQKEEWIDPAPSSDKEDCYYVRAEMSDTSMAWSSPVWVGFSAAPKNE